MAQAPPHSLDRPTTDLPEVLRNAQLRLAATALLGAAFSVSVGIGVLFFRGASELRFVLGASVCASLLSMVLVAGVAITDLVRHRLAHIQTQRSASTPQTF